MAAATQMSNDWHPLGDASAELTLGYHLIRGLAAPLRMMCYYKEQKFVNVAFGADVKEKWFEGKKPELVRKNGCINLPYIIDGDRVVTQSNTCLLYLGRRLGIDTQDNFILNHTVLDQTMDLRNDIIKIVYPFDGSVPTKEDFPAAAVKHMEGSATTNLTKLESICVGPYMCGAAPQSGDFHVFEMLDQHQIMCLARGQANIVENFPKLKALHTAMKTDPALARYFDAACYKSYAHNNGLFTYFTGQDANFVYGPSVEETIEF